MLLWNVLVLKAIHRPSKFFPIPWNVPVDPMHQVFLGAAKLLTAALISKIKSKLVFDRSLLKIMVPYDNLHKPKSVTELSFWKGGDYKFCFFFFFKWVLY